MAEPRFELGAVVATTNCLERLGEGSAEMVRVLLHRHYTGDWGDLDEGDRRLNEEALQDGSRILSSYNVDGEKVWVITDAATSACAACWTGQGECPGGGHTEGGVHFLEGPERRISTTVLLPEDY